MKLCSNVEELICENCVYSEPGDTEDFVHCNLKQMTALDCDELVKTTFCGEGEWAAEVIVDDYKKLDSGETITIKEKMVRVATRNDLIQAFLNNGYFIW
jgi:hypothetical protein